MKFNLKTILGVLTVAVSALAGLSGLLWFVVGLAIAPLDERMSAVQGDLAAQAERTDRRFAEQREEIVALGERTDRRFAEQREELVALGEKTDRRFAEQAERSDLRFAEQAERSDRSFASIRESVTELRESMAEFKGTLRALMVSKLEGVSPSSPSSEVTPDGQSGQLSESLEQNSSATAQGESRGEFPDTGLHCQSGATQIPRRIAT